MVLFLSSDSGPAPAGLSVDDAFSITSWWFTSSTNLTHWIVFEKCLRNAPSLPSNMWGRYELLKVRLNGGGSVMPAETEAAGHVSGCSQLSFRDIATLSPQHMSNLALASGFITQTSNVCTPSDGNVPSPIGHSQRNLGILSPRYPDLDFPSALPALATSSANVWFHLSITKANEQGLGTDPWCTPA